MTAQNSLTYTYLDTSALMRLAESRSSPCTPRNTAIGQKLDALFGDSARKFACSDVTLVEWHSNITVDWRRSSDPQFDEAWWEAAQAELMLRIGQRQIEVLLMPPKALEQAMALVTVATRDHGRGLRAWDALHGLIAARWSYEVGQAVELLTTDADFLGLNEVPGMSLTVSVVNLDILVQTGEGADAPGKATSTQGKTSK